MEIKTKRNKNKKKQKVIKLINFCTAKETIYKMIRQPMDLGKYLQMMKPKELNF